MPQAVRYDHTLDFGETPAWRSIETVELVPPFRVTQIWPLHHSQLGWDGRQVWTVDWRLDNPPEMMPYLTSLGLTAPFWIASPRTTLDSVGTGALPGDEREYVTLTAHPERIAPMPPSAGYYRLYLDPHSWRIAGVAYDVEYRPMLDAMGLPADARSFGPMTHVVDETIELDGVRLTARYHTIGPTGGQAGVHDVVDWALLDNLDDRWSDAPAGASR